MPLRYELNHPMISRGPSLIDWMYRYEPVLDVLLEFGIDNDILDFGSGNVGLGCVWNLPYYGIDLNPIVPQVNNMIPINDVHPFKLQRQFQFICSMDVLEHVPIAERPQYLDHLKNLTRKWLMISYPTAEAGRLFDIETIPVLAGAQPAWLFEHLSKPHPSSEQVFNWVDKSGLKLVRKWKTTNRLMHLLGLVGIQLQGTIKIKILNDIHYMNLCVDQMDDVAGYRETLLLER